MGWVYWTLFIFVFLASISAIWWPNIWPKMGDSELFEKHKLWAQLISYPALNPYGASLLTPIHFRVPTMNFIPQMAKYLVGKEITGTFKIYRLISIHTRHWPLWGESLDPHLFSGSYQWFWLSGCQIFGPKWDFRNLKKIKKNKKNPKNHISSIRKVFKMADGV